MLTMDDWGLLLLINFFTLLNKESLKSLKTNGSVDNPFGIIISFTLYSFAIWWGRLVYNLHHCYDQILHLRFYELENWQVLVYK